MIRLVLVVLLFLPGCGGNQPAAVVSDQDTVVRHLLRLGFTTHMDEDVDGVRTIKSQKMEGEANISVSCTDAYTLVFVSVPHDALESAERIKNAVQSAESVVDSIVGRPVCSSLYADENQVAITDGVPRLYYELALEGTKVSVSRYLALVEGPAGAGLAMFIIGKNY